MITFSNLRKQLTFRDIFRQTELWGLILMTCHYPDWSCLLLVETNFPFNTTNQKHYQDLGSDTSSAWEFCSSQTLFRGETSGGVQKRWPRFAFLVLLTLTKKKMWHFRFLTGTVYAVIIDIWNDESARNYLIYFFCIIYSFIHSTTSWSIKKRKKSQNLAIKPSHLEFTLGQ